MEMIGTQGGGDTLWEEGDWYPGMEVTGTQGRRWLVPRDGCG